MGKRQDRYVPDGKSELEFEYFLHHKQLLRGSGSIRVPMPGCCTLDVLQQSDAYPILGEQSPETERKREKIRHLDDAQYVKQRKGVRL